jgi:hypothetical protein
LMEKHEEEHSSIRHRSRKDRRDTMKCANVAYCENDTRQTSNKNIESREMTTTVS